MTAASSVEKSAAYLNLEQTKTYNWPRQNN